MEKQDLVQNIGLISLLSSVLIPLVLQNADYEIEIARYRLTLGMLVLFGASGFFVCSLAKKLAYGEISLLESHQLGNQFLTDLKAAFPKEFTQLNDIHHLHSAEVLYDCGYLMQISKAKIRDFAEFKEMEISEENSGNNIGNGTNIQKKITNWMAKWDIVAILSLVLAISYCAYQFVLRFWR
jgi:hypothetical protein